MDGTLRHVRSRTGGTSFAALAGYSLVAFFYFGLRILLDPGRNYVGNGQDSQIFIWALAWWPHAVLHGENPFVTHAVWAPDGVNLTWTTSVPGLALLFSPLTLLAGPFVAYNVAAVFLPALAAWTAFLLCRHLTGKLWPSLIGGYLFGFSSYMIGQEEGHQQVTAVFLIPLIVLVCVRFLEHDLGVRGAAWRLGPLFAFQLLFSTEVTFTLLLAVGGAIALGFLLVPHLRGRLIALLQPLVAGTGLGAVLTAPFLYYAITGFQSGTVNPVGGFTVDLANFVVPTNNALFAHGWAPTIAANFPGNDAERGAYLGVPALVILALFAWGRWRTPAGRFLLVGTAVSVLAAFGSELTVDGRRVVSLPWALVGHRPLFDDVLPSRLMLYVSLLACIMVALWAAAQRGGLARLLLPGLAVLAIIPNPAAGTWATSFTVPAFFSKPVDRACLRPGENILPLPIGGFGIPMLWQVTADFRFTMAGGRISAFAPASFLTPKTIAPVSDGSPIPAAQAGALVAFIKLKHVAAVVVDGAESSLWSAALDRIASPTVRDGVIVYRVAAGSPSCPTADP